MFHEDLCVTELSVLYGVIIILVCFLSALNVPVPYLIKFCNQVISQVVHSLTPSSLMTFTKNIQSNNKKKKQQQGWSIFIRRMKWKKWRTKILEARNVAGFTEAYACMHGTNLSLLLHWDFTLRECRCYPVLAIAGFLLVHLKQLMLLEVKNTAKEN